MPERDDAFEEPGCPDDGDLCAYAADVSAWLDDELAPFEADTVATHIRFCAVCASELAELRRIRVQLRSLPPRQVPEGHWEGAATQAMANKEADSHRRRSERLALTGLALAVGVAGALAWPQSNQPTRTVDVPVESFVVDHMARTSGAPVLPVAGRE